MTTSPSCRLSRLSLLPRRETAVRTLVYVPDFSDGPMLGHTQPAVKSAVTRIFVAIKQLLESRTLWNNLQLS